MGSTREKYEPWLRDCVRKRCPDIEPALLSAIDAFDSVGQLDHAAKEQLRPIVLAASSSRRPLYECVVDLLGHLCDRHEEARNAVAGMAQDPQSHVRFNALLCLRKSTPPDFTIGLLRQALQDKSARVRTKATDWAGRLRKHELVPYLDNAVAREKNTKAKDSIEFSLKLLRDGYIIEPNPDGSVNVTTFSKNGISGRSVTQTELDTRGLKAILGELAAR